VNRISKKCLFFASDVKIKLNVWKEINSWRIYKNMVWILSIFLMIWRTNLQKANFSVSFQILFATRLIFLPMRAGQPPDQRVKDSGEWQSVAETGLLCSVVFTVVLETHFTVNRSSLLWIYCVRKDEVLRRQQMQPCELLWVGRRWSVHGLFLLRENCAVSARIGDMPLQNVLRQNVCTFITSRFGALFASVDLSERKDYEGACWSWKPKGKSFWLTYLFALCHTESLLRCHLDPVRDSRP